MNDDHERRIEQAVWGLALGMLISLVPLLPWAAEDRRMGTQTYSLIDLALTDGHDRALPLMVLMSCISTALAAWYGAAVPQHFGLAPLVGVVTAVVIAAMVLTWLGFWSASSMSREPLRPVSGVFLATIPLLLVATARARVFRRLPAVAPDHQVLK